MTDGTNTTVECPLCEVAFDPTAAGGWCTNSDCGEWQYIGDEVPAPADSPSEADSGSVETGGSDESPDGAGTTGDGTKPDSEPTEAADEADPTPAIRSIDGTAADESGDAGAGTESDDTGTATGPGDADLEGDRTGEPAPADANSTDLDSTDPDSTDVDGDSGDTTGRQDTAEDGHLSCPECDGVVEPDDSFCASCGTDLDKPGVEALDACPTCGGDVDEADSFCANCGEDLEAARSAIDSTETSDSDDAASAATDQDRSAGGQSEPAGGQALTTPATSDGDENSLVLRARGESVTVSDGETVGREIRNLVTETGGDTDDAVLIHREHLRFVREDDRFYLVDLGDNPTSLNGSRLSKGDREPVAAGDEIDLSGVVTLSVEAP